MTFGLTAMDSRKTSDGGGISPTALPVHHANRSHVNTPQQPSMSSWTGPSRPPSVSFPSDGFGAASRNANLRPGATAFKPNAANVDLLANLRLLALNSTSDDVPTIVTSAPAHKHAVQEPIGTKSSSASTSPVHPKVWFTTDINPAMPPLGSHFLLIQGVKDHDMKDGIIAVLEETYYENIRGKKLIKQAEHGEHTDVIFFLDDVRVASKIVADLEGEGQLSVSFVSYDWYTSGKGVRFGSNDPKSMYVAQVNLIAEFKGRTTDFDSNVSVYSKVRDFAESFGQVMAFEQNISAQYPLWQFRVEYYKVSDADNAINAAVDGMKREDMPGWITFVKQYVPPTYSAPHVSRQPVMSTAVQTVVMPPPGAQINLSPSGRTAWFHDENGIAHPVPPPCAVANVSRGMLGGRGFRGLPPFIDARPPPAQRPLGPYEHRESHYSIDSGYPGPHGNEVIVYDADKSSRGQDIIIERIYAGHDVRTTIMLRNIPSHWTRDRLKHFIDIICENRYNFLYLRIDFKEAKNIGYAFVNFENALDIVEFVRAYVGQPWEEGYSHFGKSKVVQMSYATIQGLDSLIDKFRNSSIMDELPDYRPILVQTPGEKEKDEFEAARLVDQGYRAPYIAEIGEVKDFPSPNNRAKKERSTANAGQIGLYCSRGSRNYHERMHRSQFDRGTPAQMAEDYTHRAPYGVPPYPGMASPQFADFQFGAPQYPPAYPPFAVMMPPQGFMQDAPASPFTRGYPAPPM